MNVRDFKTWLYQWLADITDDNIDDKMIQLHEVLDHVHSDDRTSIASVPPPQSPQTIVTPDNPPTEAE